MSPEPVSQLQLNCEMAAVRKAAEWLRSSCKGVDPDYLGELELAVVEAVTNLIKHSDLAGSGAKISFQLSREDDRIEVTIIDDGLPISADALKFSQTALDFDPEDIANLPAAGLGLAIIREATDDFEYYSRNGVNTMRLIKLT